MTLEEARYFCEYCHWMGIESYLAGSRMRSFNTSNAYLQHITSATRQNAKAASPTKRTKL
jgi:hypothetical protein